MVTDCFYLAFFAPLRFECFFQDNRPGKEHTGITGHNQFFPDIPDTPEMQ